MGQLFSTAKEERLMEAPIFIGELELTEPIIGVTLPARDDGLAYTAVRLLVRMQHIPVGFIYLPPDGLDPAAIVRQVWLELATAINAQRARAGLPALNSLPTEGIQAEEQFVDETSDSPFVSVVVCTRNRPDSVMLTLRGLAAQHYRPFEIVLVDNAPSSDATKEAVLAEFGSDSRLRYVREPRPGLSCARNRGVAEATADIVAFTDDDVRVDPWWLDGIVRGFRAAPDVACVTGIIATAEINNAAQLYFHALHSREEWGYSCERRIYDLTENRDDSPLYPYAAGMFGAGANFAVSRRVVKEIGGFDEALGAGTASGGGEDLNIFMRIILSGNRIVYEPSAIVFHVHRIHLADLSKQMWGYGAGLTAALTAIMLGNARARRELPPKVISGVLRMITIGNRVRGNSTLPKGLLKQQAGGLLVGPWKYLESRRNLRQLAG
jgi:O-antigen biosynthesis protein